MKLNTLSIVGFAFCTLGCVGSAGAAPEQGNKTQTALPTESQVAASESEGLPSNAFISHMHAHAEQLDDLNYALADDDLEGAMTPAYWLSKHDEVNGIPLEWQPYLTGMREAAVDVETAPDLATARDAANRINDQCQGCHSVARVSSR